MDTNIYEDIKQIGEMWGQGFMAPGGAGLEQEWGRGVSKPRESLPEIGRSRTTPPMPRACMSQACSPALQFCPTRGGHTVCSQVKFPLFLGRI